MKVPFTFLPTPILDIGVLVGIADLEASYTKIERFIDEKDKRDLKLIKENAEYKY